MSSYEEIADRLFGSSPQQTPQLAPLEAEGAVETSGGINAALSVSPSEAQQGVRKALLNPVQMGNPDGMTAMSASDDSWKDALAGTLNDYGMGDAVDLYGNAKIGPQLQAEPPTLAEDLNAKLREQMMEREATRSALRPVDGDAESGLVRATFMLNAASKHSQGDAMSAWQLSQKLDMPFEVTLDNLASARLAGSEIVPDDIKSFAPAFLRLVQYDYDAAILWRHDLATANAVAEAFSPVDAVADTFVPMPNDDFDHNTRGAAIGRGVAKGGLGIAQALFTLGKAGIEGLGQAEDLGQRMAEGIASTIKPDSLPVDKPATETPAVSQWLGDMAQAATKAMGDIPEDAPYAGKAIWDNPEVMLDSRWWLENGISTAMSSLPAMAAYAAKGGLAAGATGFVMEAANAYNDMIADGLPDDFRTRAYAAVYGVVAGALEATGTASMFGGIPAVKATFKNMLTGATEGGVKQAVKHSAAHVGMGFLGEGGTEWLQNIAQGGLESAAKGNTGEKIFNDVLASAKELENLVLGGAFGGAMAGVHSRAEVRGERFNADIAESVQRAANAPEMVAAREEIEAITRESEAAQSRMAFAQSLEKAAAAADSSTMHQADPVLFEQEAAKLIPEEARIVWLDVVTVQEFTQGDPARLEALGLKQQDIEDAVTTGASGVQVPTMSIVARFHGEERQTLMQSARPEPGGMTQEEAQSFDPTARSEEAANRIRSVSQTSAEVNKEKTRLKQEFVQAGYPAHMAEYYATLHAAQARAFADRYGLDPVHELRQRSVVQVNPEEVAAGALHHPLNAGVNLEAPVRVVTVQPQFAGQNAKVLRKRFPAAVRGTVLAAFKAGVVNEDTGIKVGMSSNDFREHFDAKNSGYDLAHLEAIAALPELMRTAKLVESHADGKKTAGGNIKQVHRFMSALRVGEEDFAVKLTVKEFNDGSASLNMENPVKLYHHRIEKALSSSDTGKPAMPTTIATERDVEQSPPSSPVDINAHEYTLRRLLEGVNDHKGNRFFQPADSAGADENNAADAQKLWAEKGTESPYFKRWFGNSKVVDDQGKPLVVYHGTGSSFDSFKRVFGTSKTSEGTEGTYFNHLGFFFSSSTSEDGAANYWAKGAQGRGGSPSVVPAYVSLKNPFRGDPEAALDAMIAKGLIDLDRPTIRQKRMYETDEYESGAELRERLFTAENARTDSMLRKALKEAGYDGLIMDGGMQGEKWVVALDPTQIKSVFNSGKFNPADPRILYQQQRGAVSFGASGDSITSIFNDASDPSTPIHEGAHVFINDLIRVVADDGRMLEMDFHQRISANNADAKAGTIDEKLRKRRERAITQNYETHRRNIHWTARGDLEALVANANAQREAHGKAIGEVLVEVPLEAALNGSLTPEQMKTLQEVNATGFEAYVREGNAPSDALRGVFHRMKEWLKAIYRALTVNGVKPTPEVARVFDRMLATDAAIDSSKAGAAMSNEAAFFEAINGLEDDVTAEWTKKDRINYKAALNKEGDEFQRLHELYSLAEAEVSARMDKEALKERNQRWKGYYAEGKELAQDDMFYDVIAALTAKTDVPFSGISREWLERMYGKGAVADLRKTAMGQKIINSEGGMPLDAVGIADIVGNSDRAEAMGLSDADGLYNYLYDNIVVRQRSLARDAKAYADQRLADDDRLAEKTADVPGEAYRRYLDEVEASVLRMAARQGAAWRTPEQQARWIEQNRLTLATVRRQVREVLRGKPLRDIMPNMYVGEVRAALQDRNAALLAGNARDALTAVDRARTALESWIEANRIIKQREAFEKQAARLAVVKRDVIAPEAYTAIQDLLERFQTVPKRAFRDAPKPLQEVVDNLAAASGAVQSGPAVAEWLLTSDQEVNYKDLNVEQLQDVKDLLAMLERTGRDVLASNKASEAAMVKEVADAGADSMAGLKPDILAAAGSALRGWQDWNRKFFSSFAAVQWQMRQADGFTNLGPKGKRGVNEMRIYGAIVEGESRREIRMRALTDRLAPVFQRLAESAKRMEREKGKAFMGANNKPLAVPESMRQISRNNWTADNVIAMALNLGNEGNAARLREGFPDLKPEVLAQLLGDDAARLVFKEWAGKGNEGLLSAKDWRDIQEIWDTLHTQWSDIRATHERMYGFKPRGVEAREITLSIGGKAVTLPGGYYPAVYDPQLSKEVAGRNEKQDALARGEAMYAVPAARKGFTQGRANSGGGLPLMLSTGVVMSHLNDVTRFIELAETVRFADRVTQSPQWAQAYTAAFGKAQYDAIRPNLKNIVLEDRPPMDAFSIAAEKARAHLIPWGLGWNFKTALLQSTALFPAMNDLGAANVMRGVSALGIGRYTLVKEIWENSPYMKSRASNIDQDLRQAVKSIDERTRQKAVKLLGAEVTWDKVVEAGMLPLLTVDMATSAAIWLTAYNKEMGSLMDGPAGKRGIDPSSEYHKAAVLAADMAVKAVNPDFNPSSRSAFLRDRGVVRLLNMFSSAVVLFAQRRAYNAQALKHAWHQAGKDKTARLSAVGSYARYEAYDFLLPAVAMGLLQSLAGGSDDPDKWGKNMRSAYLDSFAMRLPVAGGVISGLITNETWRGMSTVFEQPVRMGQRLAGAIHQGNEEKMVGAMADALSFLTKIPVSRVVRSGMRGYDQWQRGEGTSLSLVMPSPGK